MNKYKILLSRLHLLSLIIVISNYMSVSFSGYTLSENINITVKLFFYITGMVLFFFYREPFNLYKKPYNNLTLYFSIFIYPLLITILSWITLYLGIFLTMLYVKFFSPWTKFEENEHYIVYREMGHGFLNLPDEYRVTEKKSVFFEKIIIDNVKIEHENPSSVKIKTEDNNLYLEYRFEKYKSENIYEMNDTIIFVKRI